MQKLFQIHMLMLITLFTSSSIFSTTIKVITIENDYGTTTIRLIESAHDDGENNIPQEIHVNHDNAIAHKDGIIKIIGLDYYLLFEDDIIALVLKKKKILQVVAYFRSSTGRPVSIQVSFDENHALVDMMMITEGMLESGASVLYKNITRDRFENRSYHFNQPQ